MKRSRHPQKSPPVLEGLAVPTSGDASTEALPRCDYCRRPGPRLATIGKAPDQKRLCPDCSYRAIKRKCRRQ